MYIIWQLVCINFEKQEVEQGSCAEQEQKPTANDSFEKPQNDSHVQPTRNTPAYTQASMRHWH
jgi:hypothetical protein